MIATTASAHELLVLTLSLGKIPKKRSLAHLQVKRLVFNWYIARW